MVDRRGREDHISDIVARVVLEHNVFMYLRLLSQLILSYEKKEQVPALTLETACT